MHIARMNAAKWAKDMEAAENTFSSNTSLFTLKILRYLPFCITCFLYITNNNNDNFVYNCNNGII